MPDLVAEMSYNIPTYVSVNEESPENKNSCVFFLTPGVRHVVKEGETRGAQLVAVFYLTTRCHKILHAEYKRID